jgi:hypothetical protein
MKGWVYVITNKSMPGLVKVGYTSKDPALRANELNHTGSPHPYVVDYEVLVDEPYKIEQKTHNRLSSFFEGKEWFRCSREKAIAAIQSETNGAIHLENFKRTEAVKVQEIRKNEEILSKKISQLQEWKKGIEAQRYAAENQIRDQYKNLTEYRFEKPSLFLYWFCSTVVVGIILLMVAEDTMTESGISWMSVIIGGIIAYFLRENSGNKVRESKEYKDLLQEQEHKIKLLQDEFPLEIKGIEFNQAHETVRKNFKGKSGPRGKGSALRFYLKIANSNKNWTGTLLVIRIVDKNNNDHTDYRIPIYIPPGKETEFSVPIDHIPENFSWQTIDLYGYK